MTEHSIEIPQTHCCSHYPNRVLQKKDLAAELGVHEKTVSNLMRAGTLPQPRWLNSIPVWMLYDIHAFISAAAGRPRTGDAEAEISEMSTGPKRKRTAKDRAHKAGKYSA